MDHLRQFASATAQPSSKRAAIYAYCRYSDNLTAVDVLRGLVRQLLHQVPETLPPVKEFHDTHTLHDTKPSTSEVGLLLRTMVMLLDGTHIVIDGLDEVPEETERQDLVRELRELPAQILVFSRRLDLLRSEFPATPLSIEARNEDVIAFVKSTIKRHLQLSCLLEGNSELVQTIVNTVGEKSEGM